MPVSTRRSTLGAAPVEDRSAEAVTAILNDEAGSKPSTSSPKRKRQSNVDLTPRKRTVVEIPIHVVQSARRQSGRLKARASISAPSLAPRGDPFPFPHDQEEAQGQGQGSQPALLKKLRRLHRPRSPEKSPFKGKGVLETRSTARVNLGDTPFRQAPRDLSKLQKSLLNPRRTATKSKTPVPANAALNVPFQGEEILDVQFGRNGAPPSTSPFVEPGVDLSLPDHTANDAPNEASPARFVNEANLLDETYGSDPPAMEMTREDEPSAAHFPSAQPLPPPRDEESPAEAQEDVEEEREETDVDHINGVTNPPDAQMESTNRRPQTEAEQSREEQAAAEEEAKRQERARKALRGVEEAVKIQGCEKLWEEALVGGLQLAEIGNPNEPTSTVGKATLRALNDLHREYKKLARAQSPDLQESEQSLREHYRILEERCKHLAGYRGRLDMSHKRERSRMIKDVYGHLIPSSLSLSRAGLKVLFKDKDPSVDAYERLYELLMITNILVETATKWQPRPELDKGAKAIVKHDIGPNISRLIGRYKREFEEAINDARRSQYLDDLAARQKEERETINQMAQRKRAQKLAEYRANMQSIPKVPYTGIPSSQSIVDIDDVIVDDQSVMDVDTNRSTRAPSQHVTFAARPRLRREATEDIPPPVPTEWKDAETEILLRGLQKYRTSSRFEDIVYKYGAPGGGLERFDMDQIMAKAKWARRTMAQKFQETDDPDWDWLRTVPA
ncbi:hypothetical protein A1O1_04475 [Capronia coronata CBS 617.96]|uniref:Uncharacterized protein n=1 Tax=Capronia coronata CBS 617.96 TaxID=1182541 RepID=W9YFS6_9EURO|nr:uncharacterized protein A1O1_04475 [Capronia coronata CBS 617.96]EXJ91363.1 hypothetical protein A1O1_04475 [Capronia coronata CBS 617.96]